MALGGILHLSFLVMAPGSSLAATIIVELLIHRLKVLCRVKIWACKHPRNSSLVSNLQPGWRQNAGNYTRAEFN